MPKKLILFLLLCVSYVQLSRILAVFPLPGKSHGILGNGYVKLLLEAGHEVTYVTPFPRKNPHPNLHEIDISENLRLFPLEDLVNITVIMKDKQDYSDISQGLAIAHHMAEMTLLNSNIQKFLKDTKQSFDLVIVEWLYSEIYSGFAAVYNCPYIWSSSMEPHWIVLQLIDDIPNPAYTASLSTKSAFPFGFVDRLTEAYNLVRGIIYKEILMPSYEKELYERMYGPMVALRGRELPDFNELKYNASLMLGNSYVGLGEPVRLPQNYKPIAGYHIERNTKPLPETLQKIMDNAKHGVIYFSMGSNLKSKDLPDVMKQSLLNVFGKLKQTVLWKFEETLPNLPANVHILQWAPQQSILAHNNCKLFITHGGLLSITEAVHFGVPLIGIPVFADQFMNVERIVYKGFGKHVHLSIDMADELNEAIEEVTSNPLYHLKAKQLSVVYHDRPSTPAADLVHWVQHVIKTGGAPHLRSYALMTPWYQKYYLDFLGLVTIVLLILIKLVKQLFARKTIVTKTKTKKSNRKED